MRGGSASEPAHYPRPAALRGIRLPQMHRPGALDPAQGMALPQEPDPPAQWKEVSAMVIALIPWPARGIDRPEGPGGDQDDD